MLFYIRFMSDGHSTYDSFTFVLHWTSLHVGPIGVEIYSATVIRIAIELFYIGYSDLYPDLLLQRNPDE